MNGLAYDPDTGRLLGSSPYGIGIGGIGLPRLYKISINASDEPLGLATWLNQTPPSLTGIATVTPVPEPGSIVLLAGGLAILILAGSRRVRVVGCPAQCSSRLTIFTIRSSSTIRAGIRL
jgi:hypothetical protein